MSLKRFSSVEPQGIKWNGCQKLPESQAWFPFPTLLCWMRSSCWESSRSWSFGWKTQDVSIPSSALSSARGQLFLNRLNWVPDRTVHPSPTKPRKWSPNPSCGQKELLALQQPQPWERTPASSFSSMIFGFEISEATKRIAVRPRRRTMT